MDNKELEGVIAEEEAIHEIDERIDVKVNVPVVEYEKPNIIDNESNIIDKDMEKMLDVEAMNRDIYADMESRMNQPSPLYDDDNEMSKMLEESNLDISNEPIEKGPTGL